MSSTPKIIHYCWFGPNPIPETEQRCIASWNEQLPGHKLMLWNEETFDVGETEFSRQAYELKKYAFVSDYVRTKVLYEYGGLYLDTDVELLPQFGGILEQSPNFLGFENSTHIGTAVMAFRPSHPIMVEFLDYYRTHPYLDHRDRENITANVAILTDIMAARGLKADGTRQQVGDTEIYPREFFYPKKLSDTEFRTTDQTAAIHWFSCSWLSESQKKRGNNPLWRHIIRPVLRTCRKLGMKILGRERIRNIETSIRNILK